MSVHDTGVGVEEVLNLLGRNVFAAADDEVFDASFDVDVALFVHRAEVAGVHPALRVEHALGGLGVVPVTQHHRVATGADFAGFAAWEHASGVGVDDFDFDVVLHGADGVDLLFKRCPDAGLGRYGGGFGHAVADGDFVHVHQFLHLFHHFRRTHRTRHDARAERAQVVVFLLHLFEFDDEHRGHAVERGTALALYDFESDPWVETIVGNDDGSTVGGAGHVAQHHPETVEEGDGQTNAVGRSVVHPFADEEAVVEDIVVGERNALRVARGAGGVLDIDRVVKLHRVFPFAQSFVAHAFAIGQEAFPRLIPIDFAGKGGGFHAAFAEHLLVVTRFELQCGKNRGDARLVEHVDQLVGAGSGIEVDHDDADAGRGILEQHPLVAVGRPDAYTFAGLHAEGNQSFGHASHLLVKFGISGAIALVGTDERIVVRVGFDDVAQVAIDGFAKQVCARRTLYVRRGIHEFLYGRFVLVVLLC